jgi:mannose/fructose/N-acetylgalactosamine-specific phosphotransferase system component IIB
MQIKKSAMAIAAVAALAVSPAFAANTANFGQVISSIQSSKSAPAQIEGMANVKSVNVVKVGDIAKGENMTALDQAVTKNEADIVALRSALTTNTAVNTALMPALTNAGVGVGAIVAANVESDGVLTVYVR